MYSVHVSDPYLTRCHQPTHEILWSLAPWGAWLITCSPLTSSAAIGRSSICLPFVHLDPRAHMNDEAASFRQPVLSAQLGSGCPRSLASAISFPLDTDTLHSISSQSMPQNNSRTAKNPWQPFARLSLTLLLPPAQPPAPVHRDWQFCTEYSVYGVVCGYTFPSRCRAA